MHYSYFIIKPDGIRYLDKICQNIEQKYQSVRYYAISDFETIIKKIYHKHYERKGQEFENSFGSYLCGLKEIFGNECVLSLIGDNNRTYEEFMKSIFETKIEIRQKYVNNNIGIVTNYGDECGYIRFITKEGNVVAPRIMQDIGSYRINDLNIIHCPDMTKEATLDELKILLDEGIIDNKNLIPYDMIKNMKKYNTVNFQKDMREEKYEGVIQPDISGWVTSEIKENESR